MGTTKVPLRLLFWTVGIVYSLAPERVMLNDVQDRFRQETPRVWSTDSDTEQVSYNFLKPRFFYLQTKGKRYLPQSFVMIIK